MYRKEKEKERSYYPGRPEKAEQHFVGLTCRNSGPCGSQVEKDLEAIKSGERKKNGRPFFP